MVRGLRLMQPKLEALNIPFFLLKGAFARRCRSAAGCPSWQWGQRMQQPVSPHLLPFQSWPLYWLYCPRARHAACSGFRQCMGFFLHCSEQEASPSVLTCLSLCLVHAPQPPRARRGPPTWLALSTRAYGLSFFPRPHQPCSCHAAACCAGDPVETVPQLVKDTGASLLVTDFASLRLGRQWRDAVAAKLEVPFHEVDAHNVVPAWVASGVRSSHSAASKGELSGLGKGRGGKGQPGELLRVWLSQRAATFAEPARLPGPA